MLLIFVLLLLLLFLFFFFQAEDGIRDRLVTGVQTCALPISLTMFNLVNSLINSLDLNLTSQYNRSHGRQKIIYNLFDADNTGYLFTLSNIKDY